MDQHKLKQLTSQQTLAAMLRTAMEDSPVSEEEITEAFQVLSDALIHPHVSADNSSECYGVLINSWQDMTVSAQHYHHYFEHTPHCIVITDPMGCIRDLNRAAVTFFHHGSGEGHTHHSSFASKITPNPTLTQKEIDEKNTILGRSLQSYMGSECVPQFLDYLEHLTQKPMAMVAPAELWFVCNNGLQRRITLSAQSLLNEDNHLYGVNWAIVDITDYVQAELDVQHRCDQALQSYQDTQHINQQQEQAIQEQQDKIQQQAQAIQQLETAIQTKDSQVLKATEFESTLKRITDKVRDSLDESKILQTVVRELSILLRLGGCNTALYDLKKGTSTISYEYTNFISAYRGKVAQMDDFPEIYNQLRQGHYFQFCSLIPNPERGHVALLACPIFVDSEGEGQPGEQVLGDLWLIDHKDHVFNEFEIRLVQQVANQCAIAIRQARLYKAAQAQVHELEKLNRLKDEFLSTVSHELRTPISNVKMAIHMLKNAPTEEKREQYIKILEAESQREADLINDLLDLQKLEASTCSISPKTLSLPAWLQGMVEPFRSRLESHQQTIEVECSDTVSSVRTDFNILERVLSELLNNACKYTPSGHSIRIAANETIIMSDMDDFSLREQRRESWAHLKRHTEAEAFGRPNRLRAVRRYRVAVFTVSNQAAIPAEELPHIFDKFYRIPHSDPWKQGGTGLGLALVQKLVEQLQGIVEVSSDDGWTHFTISILNQE